MDIVNFEHQGTKYLKQIFKKASGGGESSYSWGIPYRRTMDDGCGSATVLMLLQVLLLSCYGRKALIRSNMVYFWIRG